MDAQLPPLAKAALLEKKPDGARVINAGSNPPVHPNDVKFDATANEVVMTFALVTGGDSAQDPRLVQECAKLVVSWPMLEVLVTAGLGVLEQAMGFRLGALESQLRELQALRDRTVRSE